jgi:hypothetical protein
VGLREFAERLRGEFELLERVDFFVPYWLRESAVAEAILGRRGVAKESYLQLFHTEELSRGYDEQAFHLRDRGLKIGSLRLARLTSRHLELAGGRFLPLASGPPPEPRLDRARGRLRRTGQVISRHRGVWRARQLSLYKHFSYASVARRGHEEHYLLDRQFGTIAARLAAAEAQGYRALQASTGVAGPPETPDARVLASECPNCGWELRAGQQELISFCTSCCHAITTGEKRLELLPYELAALPPGPVPEALVYFPFWAFPFQLDAGGCRFTRIRDWLAAVSPQPGLTRIAESDPDPSLYFVPARSLYGSPDADRAFEQLVGWAAWRQPRLLRERPVPCERARFAGSDLSAAEAAELARYALVGLHDNASTRRLNGRNFAELIRDATLELGPPRLAVLPLPLQRGVWRAEGLRGVVSGRLLTGDLPLARATLSHGLAPRARVSS